MEWIWYWTIPMKNLDWNKDSNIVKLLEDNKKVFTEVSIFLLLKKNKVDVSRCFHPEIPLEVGMTG